MTRRSMPSSFHANLFALVPARCPSSTCGVAMVVIGAALRDVPFLPAVGDTLWARLVHWRRIGWSGKCDPVFGRIVGRGFRMGWVAESATRNIALKRDAVSPTRLNRKAHPGIRRQNGTRFPRDRIAAAESKQQPRYSPSTSAASSSWVSTTYSAPAASSSARPRKPQVTPALLRPALWPVRTSTLESPT